MVSVKSLFPTWVLKRKFPFGAIEWFFLVLFILRENSLIADIIHQELTWIILGFWLVILEFQGKWYLRGYQCSVYINLFKKNTFLVAPSNSLNGTAGFSSTSELISETVESIIRRSVPLELEKQKAKLVMDQQKEKTN